MEIERKFLIRENKNNYFSDFFMEQVATKELLANLMGITEEEGMNTLGKLIHQGYLPLEKLEDLRKPLKLYPKFEPKELRVRQYGEDYFLTVKSDGTLCREEIPDRVISRELFDSLWELTEGRRVKKIRIKLPYGIYTIEIDNYLDRDLVMVEVEFKNKKEAEEFPLLGKDITEYSRYKNKNLAKYRKRKEE